MGFGKRVVVDDENFVEVGHREHRAGGDERAAGPFHQGSVRQRPPGERDGLGGRHSSTRVVIREQRQQQPLADRLVAETASDALQPLERGFVAPRHEQVVRDQPGLEQPLELGVGAAQLVQRLAVHAVRFRDTADGRKVFVGGADGAPQQ